MAVQYLLAIEGEPSAVDSFSKQAESSTGCPFELSKALPTPRELTELSPLTLVQWYVFQNQLTSAANILEEIGGEAKLIELLKDGTRRMEALALLREQQDTTSIAELAQVRENFLKHNALTPNQWLKNSLGALRGQQLNEVTRDRVLPERLHYRFRALAMDLGFAEALSELNPTLSIGAIGLDERTLDQQYCWYRQADDVAIYDASNAGDVPDWIEYPPSVFHRQ
jgi:hypothetical protein